MEEQVEKLEIRRIRAEDASDISKIQSEITQSPATIDFRQIIEEQVRREDNVSFVAVIKGRVVGYMISYLLFGGFGLEKGAWIATFGVDPKFMGRGIGKKLAEEILGVYRKMRVHDIYTSVRWDSFDILSFFKGLGFDRSDFINLRKKLDG